MRLNLRRVILGFWLGFDSIAGQDSTERAGQEDCQSLEQVDESCIIGSLFANWLSDEYQRVCDAARDNQEDHCQH